MSRLTLFAVAALFASGCSLFSEDSYSSEGTYPLPDHETMVGTWTRSAVDTLRLHPRADTNLHAYDTIVFERKVTLRYMPDSTGWFLYEPQLPCDSNIYDECRAIYGWFRAHISDYDSVKTADVDPGTMANLYKRVNRPPRWCEYQRVTGIHGNPHPCMEVNVTENSLLIRWTSYSTYSTLAERNDAEWDRVLAPSDFPSLGVPCTREPTAEFTRASADLIIPLVGPDSLPVAMEDLTDSTHDGVHLPGYDYLLDGAFPGDFGYVENWRTVVR